MGVGKGEYFAGSLGEGSRQVSAVNIHTDEAKSGSSQMTRMKSFPVITESKFQLLFPFGDPGENCWARPVVCYTVDVEAKGLLCECPRSYTSESAHRRKRHPTRYALTCPWHVQASMRYSLIVSIIHLINSCTCSVLSLCLSGCSVQAP